MGKFGDLAKASDWSGRDVRLLAGFHAKNGTFLPKGTEVTVIRVYAGLTVYKTERCPICGSGRRDVVDRVPYDQVELRD